MTFIAPHFTLAELTTTSFRHVDNMPNGDAMTNLTLLANEQLESIRALWRCPVIVTSGYRCREIETAIHGGIYPPRGSQHGDGCAADIVPAGPLGLVDAFDLIRTSKIEYDQLILEHPRQTAGSGWIHVSRAPHGRPYRRQALLYGYFTHLAYVGFDDALVPPGLA
jgi:hypothetical protein